LSAKKVPEAKVIRTITVNACRLIWLPQMHVCKMKNKENEEKQTRNP